MKVRFVGSPVVVRAWAARFSRLGVKGREIVRKNGLELCWYGELDDRVFASVGEPPALGGHRACPVSFDRCQDCGGILSEVLKTDAPCGGRYVPPDVTEMFAASWKCRSPA